MSPGGKNIKKAIENGFLKPILEMPGCDLDFIVDLTDTFRNSLTVDLKRIEESINAENIDTMRLTVHKLRSSLEIFAVPKSTSLCNKLEESDNFLEIHDYFLELQEVVNYHLNLLSSDLNQIDLINQKPD